MTRYEKIAKAAVLAHLAGRREPVTLFSVSTVADQACRDAGKRRDLYDSLYAYAKIMPPGWRQEWLEAQGGTGDGLLSVVPASWQAWGSDSHSLLLGRGKLVAHQAPG